MAQKFLTNFTPPGTSDLYKFRAGALFYGTTSNSTTAMTVSIPGVTEYYTGLTLILKMGAQAASGCTLNVNSLGAKAMKYGADSVGTYFTSGATYLFVYDGTDFKAVHSYNSNTTYGSMSVSEGTTGTATTNRVLTAANLKGIINAHAPTKTGGGASGTWGISISGNAATATKATQDGNGNIISSTYLPLAGGTMTGTLTIDNGNSAGSISISEDGEGGTIRLYSKNGTYCYEIDSYNDEELRIHNASKHPSDVSFKSIQWSGKTGALTADSFNGNASSATKLATARTISLTGSVTGSGTFDGSGNLSIATTTNHSHSDIVSSGTKTMITDTAKWPAGFRVGDIYNSGYPFTYGTTWMYQGTFGAELIFNGLGGDAGVGTGHMYFRTRSDWATSTWGNWKKLWCTGDSVTGAVWNDYAECRESDCEEFGYVLTETGNDTLTKTTERLQPFAGISSDTWGFSQGETARARTPIAVAGRVLVYPYQDRNNYKPGDCVCAAPGGTVDIMTREEVREWPDRIVGTVSCVPDYEEWGGGKGADRDPVKVNGRIWIKVK